MTEYAVPGEPHSRLPEAVEAWTVDGPYSVIPWHCPRCEQVIAETVRIVGGDPELRTVLTIGPVPHWRAGDLDGVRYYGPTSREMRGHSPRRTVTRLRRESMRRTWAEREGGENPEGEDYAPIEVREFDTICDNCPRRLRIRLPSP